jgi:polyferredoxin
MSKISIKRFFLKASIVLALFFVVFSISLFTALPMYFDSYVQLENYKIEAHLALIIYRVVMYFSFPFIISAVEIIKLNRKLKFGVLLIENFNIQFATYALIASIYAILGLDKVLSVDVFSNADTFLFVTGFVITTIINRGIPDLVSR